MKQLEFTDIIGIILGVIAIISVYNSNTVASKIWKDDDEDKKVRHSLQVKMISFFLALIGFLIVAIF